MHASAPDASVPTLHPSQIMEIKKCLSMRLANQDICKLFTIYAAQWPREVDATDRNLYTAELKVWYRVPSLLSVEL